MHRICGFVMVVRCAVLTAVLLLTTVCRSTAQTNADSKGHQLAAPAPHPYAQAALKHTLLANKDGSWGYEISANGKPFIQQTTIPGAPGTRGYASREEAEAAARTEEDRIKGAVTERSDR